METVTFRTQKAALKWAHAFARANDDGTFFTVRGVHDTGIFSFGYPRTRKVWVIDIPEEYRANAGTFFPASVINQ